LAKRAGKEKITGMNELEMEKAMDVLSEGVER
jgi:hypothetical protein